MQAVKYNLNNDLIKLETLEQIKKNRVNNDVVVYGDEKWEDIRQNPEYFELWKIVRYYIEKHKRVICVNGYISMSSDPTQIGQILWSDVTNAYKRLL